MTAATIAPSCCQPPLMPPTSTPRRSSSVKLEDGRRNQHMHTHDIGSDMTNDKHFVHRKPSERRQVVRIQNYIIYRKTIGAGSMGKVKLAECLTDKDPTKKYAVKIMPKVDLSLAAATAERCKDPKDTPKEREQRTIREMAIMHLLRHPNICQLKEWITEGNYYYMFLEYVDGGQLLDYIISHGKLREKQARKFARQIISALDYCHRNSIVHRDLKIENILITRNEEIKIIDFGLSNIYSPSSLLNTFCGSLYFAAPELLKARKYTGPEVDVWSFGVVLYVLVCGRVPFDDTSLPELHAKIKSGIVDEYPDHLSKECIDLLSKVLVVDPTQRATLSAVRHHPWMNKGYDEPVRNHLPHRQPLEDIDMDIVEGMHGFGLGTPEEIKQRLQHIISSPLYQQAALKVDHNYRLQMNQTYSAKPTWRRSLTRKRVPLLDDPQSLPAMYDPLISIYYLVKERREYDERCRYLQRNQSLYSTSSTIDTTQPRSLARAKSSSQLHRRPTDIAHDFAASPAYKPTSEPLKRSTSVRLVRSTSERTSRLTKRIGSILRRPSLAGEDSPLSKSPNLSLDSSSRPAIPPMPSSGKKSIHHWLKIETVPKSDAKSTSAWNRLTISPRGRSSLDETQIRPTITDLRSPLPELQTRRSGSIKDRRFFKDNFSQADHHLKSFFLFDRRQLFRSTPQQLIDELYGHLERMNMQTEQTDASTLSCKWPYREGIAFLRNQGIFSNDEAVSAAEDMATSGILQFQLIVHQVRWAGGRLALKIKEVENDPLMDTKLTRSIYRAILHHLESKLQK